VEFHPGTRILKPPAWPRLAVAPDLAAWRRRDLFAEIRWLARLGRIPVTVIPDDVESLQDYTDKPAGWKAYGLVVPPGGTLIVEVQHVKPAWFRLLVKDKHRQYVPGARQEWNPSPLKVGFQNTEKVAKAFYVLVDDPAQWSDAASPYTLLFRRDWDPAKTNLGQVDPATGPWAAHPSVTAEFKRMRTIFP
jgi:hypothetical protein